MKIGKYERVSLYDYYPDLEQEARNFALKFGQLKTAIFKVKDLAIFVTKRFKEIELEHKLEENELVRSEWSCRVDLLRWGAKWDHNKNRPYFEGHERDDVVTEREKFVEYFHANKHLYYSVTPGPIASWVTPIRTENSITGDVSKIRILLAHDESTFKAGEIQSHRWIFPENAPLYSKGRGKGLMLSYFIVMHDTEILFELDKDEWNSAVKEYPKLLSNSHSKLNFFERSASGWLETGKDNYVDNETILEQFERLFILLKFKKCFSHASIEIIVDNARTHSAKQYDLMRFNKFDSLKKSAYEEIEWISANTKSFIKCSYTDSDTNLVMSKGLFTIAKELKLIDEEAKSSNSEYNLPNIRRLLAQHPAFNNVSKLEVLGAKWNVKIIFCPKFHCECNPIEGFWCYLKQYVRKRNDQNFDTMKKLILEGIDSYKEISAAKTIHLVESNLTGVTFGLNMKLWKRFWKVIKAYKDGDSYQNILESFFGAKSSSKIQNHKKNDSFNTLINRE